MCSLQLQPQYCFPYSSQPREHSRVTAAPEHEIQPTWTWTSEEQQVWAKLFTKNEGSWGKQSAFWRDNWPSRHLSHDRHHDATRKCQQLHAKWDAATQVNCLKASRRPTSQSMLLRLVSKSWFHCSCDHDWDAETRTPTVVERWRRLGSWPGIGEQQNYCCLSCHCCAYTYSVWQQVEPASRTSFRWQIQPWNGLSHCTEIILTLKITHNCGTNIPFGNEICDLRYIVDERKQQ